ncbi:MAG: HEPN domain-containing protein [Beijerinckiaceae bacterium]
MKRPADAKAYMSKAQRALATARLLLKEKDTEGACNRAYYAMFYAAHVALLKGSGAATSEFKTHGGLIGAFGKQVILGLKMNPDLGRSINEVQRLRQVADYTGDSPSLDDTREAVAEAETFVAAIRARFMGTRAKS